MNYFSLIKKDHLLDDTEEDEDAADDNTQRAEMTKERISDKRKTAAMCRVNPDMIFADQIRGRGKLQDL